MKKKTRNANAIIKELDAKLLNWYMEPSTERAKEVYACCAALSNIELDQPITISNLIFNHVYTAQKKVDES